MSLSVEKSGESFSQCLGNSFRQTIAGIFSDHRMKSSVMLDGHLSSTLHRCSLSEGDYILVHQDTTYYNYSGHHSMKDLGIIQGKVKGVIQHNALATSEIGIPLGVMYQEYWSRGSSQGYQDVESKKWSKCLQQVSHHLQSIDKRVVLIQDREADIFSFLQTERACNMDLLVRVYQPRNLELVQNGQICKMTDLSQSLPVIGQKQVEISRNGKELILTLDLQATQVNVLSDKTDLSGDKKTQGLTLVIAKEIAATDSKGKDVFNENEKAVWYLLTSLGVDNKEDACQITNFYSLRWRIERFHYTLKSGGLNVEKLQFDDLTTTINALAFYSIVAWQILAIVYLTRQKQDQQANACFEQNEILILEKTSKKNIHTVKEATLALAKLASFAPSKRQPMPGIKVLAQALEKFHYIKIGFNAKI